MFPLGTDGEGPKPEWGIPFARQLVLEPTSLGEDALYPFLGKSIGKLKDGLASACPHLTLLPSLSGRSCAALGGAAELVVTLVKVI